ncbi:hypothetical protein ACES2I_07785 [Bdellovibrio bacteriovorus]|uniref:PglD-related sugar-binding protein n=1 Tax=Bdellovibrio bacteriovorus TaxID=959 RepID=UPI0035A71E59
MNKSEVLVIGAGGHAKVASEIIRQNGWNVAAYIDEGATAGIFQGKSVFKTLDAARNSHSEVKHAFVAIGANNFRRKWHLFLTENGYNIPMFIHRTAWVSESASIDAGSIVCANAVVGADCKVGPGAIINCGTILDHDSKVGAFTHLSQGVIAGGAVHIGNNVLIGPGSTLEKLSVIDNDAQISAMSHIATARQ